MEAPVLTASTVSYLFAAEWAPPADPSRWHFDVPGLRVDGPATASNLLLVAFWRLRDREVIEIEQLRPYLPETKVRLRFFNEPSFTRATVIDESVALPGLQGALLRTLKKASKDDERDVRRVVKRLGLDYRNPWSHVGAFCLGEAKAAGVAEMNGRAWSPRRKPVITNQAAFEALRPYHEEIRAQRKAYRAANEEVDDCVMADCMWALDWSHGEAD